MDRMLSIGAKRGKMYDGQTAPYRCVQIREFLHGKKETHKYN